MQKAGSIMKPACCLSGDKLLCRHGPFRNGKGSLCMACLFCCFVSRDLGIPFIFVVI